MVITIFCVVSVLDIFVSFAVHRTWRLSQFIRPVLLLIVSKSVRRTLLSILSSLPPIVEVLFLLFALIVFFSWFGLLLWVDLPGQQLYNNVANALSSTQTLISTVNFPDVMIPFYQNSWWSCIFFFLYMVIGFYFLLPLILALTYNEYKKRITRDSKKYREKQLASLKAAFTQLDVTVIFLGPFFVLSC